MKITYKWGMPHKWTFQCPPIKEWVESIIEEEWIDPFAGNSTICRYRNDMAHSGLDAYDYLKVLDDDIFNGAVFDPPYSLRQVKEHYESVGIKDWQSRFGNNKNGGFPNVKDEIARVVMRGGKVLSFGWSSSGMGTKRGFIKKEILLVGHGGNHHDTICVLEEKK